MNADHPTIDSLRVLLGLDEKPLLTAQELAQAKDFHAKEVAFTDRLEAHTKDKAKEHSQSALAAYGRGESIEHPVSKEEMIQRFDHIRRAVRNAWIDWTNQSGILAFLASLYLRAFDRVETYRLRLEKQERQEAETLGLAYQPSATIQAVEAHGARLAQIANNLSTPVSIFNGARLANEALSLLATGEPSIAATAKAREKASAAPVAGDEDETGI